MYCLAHSARMVWYFCTNVQMYKFFCNVKIIIPILLQCYNFTKKNRKLWLTEPINGAKIDYVIFPWLTINECHITPFFFYVFVSCLIHCLNIQFHADLNFNLQRSKKKFVYKAAGIGEILTDINTYSWRK